MYRIIDETGAVYSQYVYTKEAEFEKMVIAHASTIFGADGIYFDIKKLIGTPKKGATIPDGYYLDLTFHTDPRLYLVEVELCSHDVYGHIGEQILRFGISSESDKYRLKNHLLTAISSDRAKQKQLEAFFAKSGYSNSNELLDRLIFDNRPAAIVVIDEATVELQHVMAQLTMTTEVIEAQTYISGDRKLHRFSPFKGEVLTSLPASSDADELDTIVVPAREDGFQEEFLGNERWYAVRIASTMLNKIRYIAAYQVAPISGITHIAEVERIEKYKDTSKYIVFFKVDSVKQINRIGLGTRKGLAPQAPRYSSCKTLLAAKTLDDIWS